MASDSFIICPDCGTKTIVPPSNNYSSKCYKCLHHFGVYYKCSLCNNFTKTGPCEICGYNPDTKQLTYMCKTCGEPIRKDSSACGICSDWPTSLKNITKSILAFSHLNNNGLIRRGQFEAKVIDIVESSVSNNISFKDIKDYLIIFKMMLDNNQIDKKIYDKISDTLLARCEVSEKSQESLSNKKEKSPEIGETDNLVDLPPKVMGTSLQISQAYYTKGLDLIDNFRDNEGINFIAHAASLGNSEAKRYLKENKLEAKANNLLKLEKGVKTTQKKTQEIGETDRYLQSRDIEKPPDTHYHDKADAPSKDQTKKRVGVKIIWMIVTLFVGSIVMGLIKEFQGFGILHGLAGIGTVCGLFFVWKR